MRLPLNCTVDYIEDFLDPAEADELYRVLIDDYGIARAPWVIEAAGRMVETDSYKILFVTERLKEMNSHPEKIHGKSFLWEGPLARLRERVEELAGQEFELAMCLYYPDGNYHAPWHSDQQTSGHRTILPSLSLGEVRTFAFRELAGGDEYALDLAHGSLLVMGDHCQDRYEHSLLKDPKYRNGRINITFREPGFQ